eukprot:CAMPEP_0119330724 /NCGR_PEP_ID=MMETSP1333-20130426/78873_1 /TAXON_ID=418940 /ORGANISM="Scyphosphaera apsteinii, Strain RCC1455" /LENGTH=451 /DNA_ID=CAMNT_0007340165 /DNA_START=14 /DNA_END=1369 /DNA_ORIENTATION=-
MMNTPTTASMHSTIGETSPPEIKLDPLTLSFTFSPNQTFTQYLTIGNLTSDMIAYKIKTTNPRRYSVKPNIGFAWPQTVATVNVQLPATPSLSMDATKCKDKFQVLTLPLTTTEAAQLQQLSEDARRTALEAIWKNSERTKGCWVDKLRSTIVIEDPLLRKMTIPEERPLSPCGIDTPAPACRSEVYYTSRKTGVPSDAAVSPTGGEYLASALAAAAETPCAATAAPDEPAAEAECTESQHAEGGMISAQHITQPAAQPAADAELHAEALGELMSEPRAGSKEFDKLKRDNTALRSRLEEAEDKERVLCEQIERAIREHESDTMKLSTHITSLQAELATLKSAAIARESRMAQGIASSLEGTSTSCSGAAPKVGFSLITVIAVAVFALFLSVVFDSRSFLSAALPNVSPNIQPDSKSRLSNSKSPLSDSESPISADRVSADSLAGSRGLSL